MEYFANVKHNVWKVIKNLWKIKSKKKSRFKKDAFGFNYTYIYIFGLKANLDIKILKTNVLNIYRNEKVFFMIFRKNNK